MSLIDSILSALAPYNCLGCNSEGKLLCKLCVARLARPPAFDHPLIVLANVRAVTGYNGITKDLIWQLKSAGAQAAAKIMATEMCRYVQLSEDQIIVPVPTASRRVRQRGYDQAKLLAKALARQSRLPYVDCLVRRGQTHQVGATRQQRLQQLQGAFRVRRSSLVKEREILLIDDVITTGASMELAAHALKQNGAISVQALTFAQA